MSLCVCVCVCVCLCVIGRQLCDGRNEKKEKDAYKEWKPSWKHYKEEIVENTVMSLQVNVEVKSKRKETKNCCC